MVATLGAGVGAQPAAVTANTAAAKNFRVFKLFLP